jgi:hypothetical protein
MGKYNSSETRVGPVFRALNDKDASGDSWLRPLLTMAVRTDCERVAEIPSDLGQLQRPPQFELPADPARSFLRYLIEHTQDLQWPQDQKVWDKWSDSTRTMRRRLQDGDPGARADALTNLEKTRSLPKRTWWRFEGVTMVDCALLTSSTVVFIEGKRTELGPASEILWYRRRNQVLRGLDCCAQYAHQTARSHYFVMLIVDKDSQSDQQRRAEIEKTVSPEVVAGSLPHLTEQGRGELMTHYLGVTTWQDIVRKFRLPESALPETTQCA